MLQSLSKAGQEYEVRSSSQKSGRNNNFLTRLLRPLISGNLPEGSSILLFGLPSVGKTVFCENVANGGLRNNSSCVYVTLDKSPDDVRSSLQLQGTDTFREERRNGLIFVDGFNWLLGESQEGYHVENLGNLTGLSIQIASAADFMTRPSFLIFDSVSPLLVYNPENAVVKFIQILLARIKTWNSTGFFVVQDGVHTESFYNTLSYLVDGIFEMKIEEKRSKIMRFFRIRSLKSMAHATRWVPFIIQTNREFKLKLREGKTVVA